METEDHAPRPDSAPNAPPARLGALTSKITRRTLDFICFCIIAGGLMTVALNLREPDAVGQIEALPRDEAVGSLLEWDHGPLRQRTVQGDEAAAFRALQDDCRSLLAEEVESRRLPSALSASESQNENVLERDPAGRWELQNVPEFPHTILGVLRSGNDSLICCWGMIRPAGDNLWSVAVIATEPGDPPGLLGETE